MSTQYYLNADELLEATGRKTMPHKGDTVNLEAHPEVGTRCVVTSATHKGANLKPVE